jgi:hypothetical protein
MTNRWFLLSGLTVLVIALAIGWLVLSGRVAYFSGRVAYFTLERRSRIEVNGVPVEGEILGNRFSAIVTRRDAGKQHSYQLFFEGDVDFTGDMGFVADCHEWVAPHFPFLLQTRSYPPCKRLPEDEHGLRRWPLILRSHSMQFVTKDHSTISIVTPSP